MGNLANSIDVTFYWGGGIGICVFAQRGGILNDAKIYARNPGKHTPDRGPQPCENFGSAPERPAAGGEFRCHRALISRDAGREDAPGLPADHVGGTAESVAGKAWGRTRAARSHWERHNLGQVDCSMDVYHLGVISETTGSHGEEQG